MEDKHPIRFGGLFSFVTIQDLPIVDVSVWIYWSKWAKKNRAEQKQRTLAFWDVLVCACGHGGCCFDLAVSLDFEDKTDLFDWFVTIAVYALQIVQEQFVH